MMVCSLIGSADMSYVTATAQDQPWVPNRLYKHIHYTLYVEWKFKL